MKIDLFKTALVILLAGYLLVFFKWVQTHDQNVQVARFEYTDGGLILDTVTGALYSFEEEKEEDRAKADKVVLVQEPVLKNK